MKQRTRIITALIVAFLCCLYAIFTGKLYFSSDNFDISLILNGYYANPLSQYQHPLLCLIINGISCMLPFADAFMLIIHAGVFIEIAILFYLLADVPMSKSLSAWKLQDYMSFGLALLSTILLSAGFKVWYVNYTITTASFVLSGNLALAVAKKRKKNTWWIAIGTALISVGFMLRKESGLLFAPFVVLILVADLLSSTDRQTEVKSILKYCAPACVMVILIMTSQMVFNAVEPYASAKQFNDARTIAVDFPMKPWSQISNQDSISRADYDAATNWLFSDTEIMDAEQIGKIAKAGSDNQYELSSEGLQKAVADMWHTAGKTDVYISLAVLLTLLLLFRNVVSERSIWRILAAVFAFAGGFLILLYYTIAGRAPLRVWEPVIFATLVTEVLIMLGGKSRWNDTAHIVFLLIISVVLYFGAGQVIAHTEFNKPQMAIIARVDALNAPYAQTINDDDLYIWPNWHATIPEEAEKTGKLPSQAVIDHNIALGDWTSGQPYYTAFLERIGHPNPIRDLVEKDNVYIMGNDRYIQRFLQEHYGEDIELVEAGEVNGNTSYRAERAGVQEDTE